MLPVRSWVCLAALLLLSLAALDLVAASTPETWVLSSTERIDIEYPANKGGRSESRVVKVWISPRFVREDVGERVSYLLDRRERRLLVFDHRERTWREYPVPVRIEQHLGEMEAARLALVTRPLDRIESEEPVREEVGGRTATRRAWTARLQEVEVQATWWLAAVEGVDSEAYWELARSVSALHPVHRVWMAAIDPPLGFPVRQVLRFETRFDERRERTLDSVGRTTAAAGRFTVPEGYRQVPSRCLHDLAIAGDPACH